MLTLFSVTRFVHHSSESWPLPLNVECITSGIKIAFIVVCELE